MPNELKPCKYCGGTAELVRVGDFKDFFAYRCSCCHKYHAKASEARRTPWGAKRVWNRNENKKEK